MDSATALELTTITAVAAAVSALVSAIGALGVFLQVKAAGNGNAALVLLSFSERYNSAAMAAALRRLARWRLSSSEEFATLWATGKATDDDTALQLNEDRRLVSRFYFDVARLYETGLIGKRHARALLSNNGLNIFYQVCEPMNVANHPGRVGGHADILRRLMPSYGSGLVHSTKVAAAASVHGQALDHQADQVSNG